MAAASRAASRQSRKTARYNCAHCRTVSRFRGQSATCRQNMGKVLSGEASLVAIARHRLISIERIRSRVSDGIITCGHRGNGNCVPAAAVALFAYFERRKQRCAAGSCAFAARVAVDLGHNAHGTHSLYQISLSNGSGGLVRIPIFQRTH